MKNRITPEKINSWLLPWPLQPQKKQLWRFRLLSLDTVLKWKNPNKLPNLGRISFNEVGDRMKNGDLAGLQDHYIKVLVKDWIPTAKGLVVIAVKLDGQTVVVDGSHRLSALAFARKIGKTFKMQYVGVLTPYEKVGKKRKKR